MLTIIKKMNRDDTLSYLEHQIAIFAAENKVLPMSNADFKLRASKFMDVFIELASIDFADEKYITLVEKIENGADRIPLIKELRTITNCELKEGKEEIDRMVYFDSSFKATGFKSDEWICSFNGEKIR